MKKINVNGQLKPYPPLTWSKKSKEEWYISEPSETKPNLECTCGNKDFNICWWDYPYTGGYCKIYCTKCGKKLVLIDDYA